MKKSNLYLKGSRTTTLISIVSLLVLVACSHHPSINNEPSAKAPRIINDPNNHANRLWDNSHKFGPVPDHLRDKGRAVCDSMNSDKVHYNAVGYHPNAQNYEGETMEQGGYYCVPK